ncbi:MAG: methylated-DNA--[protein]-cysteine S-methyltransferase [Chloroflexi bacterium]|nr:methylated-DNA--[protein]-cysteine S-methyltransferase [Chloroflexota bacterium]
MLIHYCVFDTPIGTAGLAWGDRGIVGVQLPEPDAAQARARLRRRFRGGLESPPAPEIAQTIEAIRALLGGTETDLSSVHLDMDAVEPFERRVYALARAIPAGQTATYGQLATRLGDPLLARDVGQALGRNPFPIVVPCHRVLAAGGKLGGFSAPGGVATKQRLLAIEQADVSWQLSLGV